MSTMRRLGVYGKNNRTKKSKTVQPSDFSIAGLIGFFERKFKVPFLCNDPDEAKEIFGDHISSSNYGWDSLQGFFDNIVGTDGKIYVLSHVGYDGAVYDAVAATATLLDGSAANTLQVDSAYKGELDYGLSGNRTGYTITNGYRYTTALNGATLALDAFVTLDSVIGVTVGDIIRIDDGVPIYKKITSIDEGAQRVNFAGTVGAIVPDNTAVYVIGFQLKTFRKSISGIVSEVEEELGEIWCTMEPEVTDFYVENVHAENKWVKGTDLSSVSVLNLSFPADVATVTYLTTGADGTTPTLASHWSQDLLAFNNKPIRMLANCETVDVTIQKAIETYCRSRWDNPKTIFNIQEDRSKAQMQAIGYLYQRSDEVDGVIAADWLKVSDPFATSSIAPDREIPNVGHVMGAWIRTIGLWGIHYVPSIRDISLYGINGITTSAEFSDGDRTDIAEAGVNIIQFIQGSGYIIRNFFTPSTATEYKFANGILMKDYIKISAVDSLQGSENTPNSFDRIKEDKTAIVNFLYRLWNVGSTGAVPTGETFGQSLTDSGVGTAPEDHFEVVANTINNPQSSINLGERNLDVWFTCPTPAGSIRIGVGLWLRS